jgi:hypothetical protein
MKIKLNIDIGEGPYQVTTSFGNVIEWERKFKKQASDLAKGVGYEDLAFLAFVASKSAGLPTPAVFDDFVKKIVDVDVLEEDPTNPTQAAAGATD